MKKLVLGAIATMVIMFSKAQSDTSRLYLQYPDIPPFDITSVPDSGSFSKSDLKKRKPTLIILFSPDCEHCQHETKALKENIDLLSNVQIVMISFLDYDLIKKFYNDYQIEAYPNIHMGKDGKYFLGTFYKIQTFPSMFLYNKKGKFITNFEGSIAIDKIAAAFKN
jgi:thioredoxin-related protein